jgi:exo-beta-1,3-glucanase (GH17 family)
MTVFLGNYAIATDNGEAYNRQRDLIKDAIQTFGTDHVDGVTVGNEFMLNYLNANGATDPNSAVGDQGAALLRADIEDTRNMLNSMSLSKHIPVGTSDAGSYFNTLVLQAVEYGVCSPPDECPFLSYILLIVGQCSSLVRQRIDRHCC